MTKSLPNNGPRLISPYKDNSPLPTHELLDSLTEDAGHEGNMTASHVKGLKWSVARFHRGGESYYAYS